MVRRRQLSFGHSFQILEVYRRSKKFSKQVKTRQTFSGDQLVTNKRKLSESTFYLKISLSTKIIQDDKKIDDEYSLSLQSSDYFLIFADHSVVWISKEARFVTCLSAGSTFLSGNGTNFPRNFFDFLDPFLSN